MGLFSGMKSKEEKFWLWFQENREILFNFEKDQESIFDKLLFQLKKVYRDLAFEFGPVENDKREFIISADGIKAAFPAVEKLFAAAPKLDEWIILKYRPRRNPICDLDFQNKTIKADDIYYRIFKNENSDKLGLLIFFKEFKEQERDIWNHIGYLFLDEALGEYDVETKIGTIMFTGIDSEYFKDAQPLKGLADEVDKYFKK